MEPEITTATVESLALAAGLLPEQLPGNKLYPIKLNHQTWQLRAAMALNKWALDTQVTQEEFDAAISVQANALAR